MTHVPRANVWRDPHVHRVSLSASCSVRVSLSLHRNPIPARSFGRGICAHTVALGILIIIPFFDVWYGKSYTLLVYTGTATGYCSPARDAAAVAL